MWLGGWSGDGRGVRGRGASEKDVCACLEGLEMSRRLVHDFGERIDWDYFSVISFRFFQRDGKELDVESSDNGARFRLAMIRSSILRLC